MRDTNHLRQTDGERFFGSRKHVEFAKDSDRLILDFTTLRDR